MTPDRILEHARAIQTAGPDALTTAIEELRAQLALLESLRAALKRQPHKQSRPASPATAAGSSPATGASEPAEQPAPRQAGPRQAEADDRRRQIAAILIREGPRKYSDLARELGLPPTTGWSMCDRHPDWFEMRNGTITVSNHARSMLERHAMGLADESKEAS